MLLQRPVTLEERRPQPNTRTLPPPSFTGDDDEIKGSEQNPLPPQPVSTLPPPRANDGVKGSEQDYPPDYKQSQGNSIATREPLPPPMKSALQQSEENYNDLQNKKTPDDNDKSFFKRLGATLREFGKKALAGGAAAGRNASASERLWSMLGGGIAGGIGYQIDPQIDERENLQKERAKAWGNYQIQSEMEKQRQERARTAAQTQTIYNDDSRQQQIANDNRTYREGQLLESAAKRESVEKNTQMRTVASMWGKLPNYDPADPRFAEITKAMGDVNLPLTPKDSKKVVKQIQDAETGAWSLTLTDPVSGAQEVRPITTKDGKQLVTTSTAKVMANAASERQQSQQTFQATENEKNRAARKQLQVDAQKYGREQTLTKAVNAFKTAYQRVYGTLPSAEEIQQFQQATEINIDTPIE